MVDARGIFDAARVFTIYFMDTKVLFQYVCAAVLIVTSIVMAFYQVIHLDDITNGTLMYIAQAFMLSGTIFGFGAVFTQLKNEIKH